MGVIRRIKIRQESLLGGQVRSVPAFYQGQNANGSPDHYVSPDQARLLRDRGEARFIHRGTAILIRGLQPLPWGPTRESIKSGWKVVGQTPAKPLRPGFPHYASVGKR